MSVIDQDLFKQNFQYFDKEIVLEIINIFIEEYPTRMQTIKKNIDEKDFDQLRFNAHSLKGVIANFVAPEPQELARSLEMKGTNKEEEGVENLFSELKEKADLLVEELKELRQAYE
jgi:HPt (histidine-containing phosphotransfer) domain-containing protein